MAQRVVVELTSDLSGDSAQETISFALEGVSYEIDLTTSEAAALRESLADYVAKGRRLGRKPSAARPSRQRSSTSSSDPAAVRAWAESNGIAVSGRGRISRDVQEKYEAAGH